MTIVIGQEFVDGNYIYYIELDDDRIFNVEWNRIPPVYKNVAFYLGRDYGHVADAHFRNISYTSGC